MSIYFIRAGAVGPVKIGWAKNAEARRKQLQIGHHQPLRVVRLIEGQRAAERWLHERFAAQRLEGEWFQFDADMLSVEPPDLQSRPNWRQRAKVAKKGRPVPVSWAATRCSRQRPCTQCLGLLTGAGMFPVLP